MTIDIVKERTEQEINFALALGPVPFVPIPV